MNYDEFRRNLAFALVTVELAHDTSIELREGDADILILLSGGEVLLQNERLFNIAVAALPSGSANRSSNSTPDKTTEPLVLRLAEGSVPNLAFQTNGSLPQFSTVQV